MIMGKKKRRKIKAKAKRKAAELARKVEDKVEDKPDRPDKGRDKAGDAAEISPKFLKKQSGLPKEVILDIHREALRQCVEGIQGWSGTPLNPQMPDGHKFVLMERQAGNVAESLATDSADSEHLYRECIRSAVVAATWAASLRAGDKRRPTQWASA